MPKIFKHEFVRVILDCDKDDEQPSAFLYQPMTTEMLMPLLSIQDEIDQGKLSAVESVQRLLDCVKVGLVGWENMGGREFDASTVGSILDPWELMELLEKMLLAQRLDTAEKKVSESPLAPEPGLSVKAALPATAANGQ